MRSNSILMTCLPGIALKILPAELCLAKVRVPKRPGDKVPDAGVGHVDVDLWHLLPAVAQGVVDEADQEVLVPLLVQADQRGSSLPRAGVLTSVLSTGAQLAVRHGPV